jgi:ADP-heptose:LPS heptosyltransferase
LVDRVLSRLTPDVRWLDLAGDLDLATLAAVLDELDLFITADTGPMHLAATVGTPLVALFGPSDPNRWGPLSSRAAIVRHELPCSPCNRIRQPPQRCVGGVPQCLAAIEVDDVYRAAVSLLNLQDV